MAKAKKPGTTPWINGNKTVEDLAPDELIAHETVTERADLTPSVQRIMDAELDEAGRCKALTSFRDSLQQPGDPNRDPMTAIANAS